MFMLVQMNKMLYFCSFWLDVVGSLEYGSGVFRKKASKVEGGFMWVPEANMKNEILSKFYYLGNGICRSDYSVAVFYFKEHWVAYGLSWPTLNGW